MSTYCYDVGILSFFCILKVIMQELASSKFHVKIRIVDFSMLIISVNTKVHRHFNNTLILGSIESIHYRYLAPSVILGEFPTQSQQNVLLENLTCTA